MEIGQMTLRKNCDLCVLKKVKCDGCPEKKCTRCLQTSQACTFTRKQKPGPKGNTREVPTTPVATPLVSAQRSSLSLLALLPSSSNHIIGLGNGSTQSGGDSGGGGGLAAAGVAVSSAGGGGSRAPGPLQKKRKTPSQASSLSPPFAGGGGRGAGGGGGGGGGADCGGDGSGGRAVEPRKNKRKTTAIETCSSSPPKRARGGGRGEKRSSSVMAAAAAGGTWIQDPYHHQSKLWKPGKHFPVGGTACLEGDHAKRRRVLATDPGPARHPTSRGLDAATTAPPTTAKPTPMSSIAQNQQHQQHQQMMPAIDPQASNARGFGAQRKFCSDRLDTNFGGDVSAQLGIDLTGQFIGAGIASSSCRGNHGAGPAAAGSSYPPFPDTAAAASTTSTAASPALSKDNPETSRSGGSSSSSSGSSGHGAHLATGGMSSPRVPSAAAVSRAAAAVAAAVADAVAVAVAVAVADPAATTATATAASLALNGGVQPVHGDVAANPAVMASHDEGGPIDGDERFGLEGLAPPDPLHYATDESLCQWEAGLLDELQGMVPQIRGGAPGVGVQRAAILSDEL
eukprot:g13807.t1